VYIKKNIFSSVYIYEYGKHLTISLPYSEKNTTDVLNTYLNEEEKRILVLKMNNLDDSPQSMLLFIKMSFQEGIMTNPYCTITRYRCIVDI
jgi:hypothetical protein